VLTAQDIYDSVAWCLMGANTTPDAIYNDRMFFADLNKVLNDFYRRTGVAQTISIVQAVQDQSFYAVPDGICEISAVLYDSVFLPKCESITLDTFDDEWKIKSSKPSYWYEDSTQPGYFGVYPAPSSTGESVSCEDMYGTIGYGSTAFDVDGAFYGTIGSITTGQTLPIDMIASREFVGTIISLGIARKNFAVIGFAAPISSVSSLSDVIHFLPKDYGSYISFGCLAEIFSGHEELKDAQKAEYCLARYEEGVVLARSVSNEFRTLF